MDVQNRPLCHRQCTGPLKVCGRSVRLEILLSAAPYWVPGMASLAPHQSQEALRQQ
jgi:hypothetical protein